jgi:hypothetical protein
VRERLQVPRIERVLHEVRRREDRRGEPEPGDALLDGALALEDGHGRRAVGARSADGDERRAGSPGARLRKRDAVAALACGPGPVGSASGHDEIGAAGGGLEAARVVEVGAHDLGARPDEPRRGSRAGVADASQHTVPAIEQQPGDGAADPAAGSKDER